MKRLFYGLLILLAIFAIFKGCQNKQPKKTEAYKEEVARKETLEYFYRYDAILLALKYKVDEEKVFNIIIDENDMTYSKEAGEIDMEGFFDRFTKKARQRIEGYSIKYDIPTDIVASILIDYKIMQRKASD